MSDQFLASILVLGVGAGIIGWTICTVWMYLRVSRGIAVLVFALGAVVWFTFGVGAFAASAVQWWHAGDEDAILFGIYSTIILLVIGLMVGGIIFRQKSPLSVPV